VSEALTLKDCLPIANQAVPAIRPLRLSHLRQLSITGTLSDCNAFLRSTHLPPACSLKLVTPCLSLDRNVAGLYDEIIAHISAFLRRGKDLQRLYDLHAVFVEDVLELELQTRRNHANRAEAASQTILVSLSCPYITVDFLNSAFCSLPLHTIRSAWLEISDHSLDTWDYAQLFNRLKSITDLFNFQAVLSVIDQREMADFSSPPCHPFWRFYRHSRPTVFPKLSSPDLRQDGFRRRMESGSAKQRVDSKESRDTLT
jgi:hypothetical protein